MSAPGARTNPTTDPRRTGLRGAAIAGVVILVFAAVVFTTSAATEEAAEDGIVAQRAESVLGSGTIALKALGQAVLLAEDRELGVAGDETVQLAVDEAAAAISHLSQEAVALQEAAQSEDAATLVDPAVAEGRRVLEFIAADNVEAAGEVLTGSARDAFESLRDGVADLRNARDVSLQNVDSLASRVANIVRFLVAFLLPLVAIIAYRVAARRQLRVAEIQLDARLEAEHEVVKAKDEFIANMSHELRTPLTTIYGFSEVLLESEMLDPESALDLIGMINTESAELGRMVEDLLVAARVDAGGLVYAFEDVDVSSEVTTVMGPLDREGHEISVDMPDITVWADPLRLRQIVRNLLSNAVRYGGKSIRVRGLVEGSNLRVSVTDDGPGVPEEMEPRLFTRFVHDGDKALTVGSVGLGLGVVKSLAEGMGGNARYQRQNGLTTFSFTVPLASAAGEGPANGRVESTPGAGIQIAAATARRGPG